MSKTKSLHKIVPFLLIISILLSACDVPDISKFTETSGEMTRGIRKGVKDTGGVLETAAASNQLFEKETIAAFKKHSQNYNSTMQPTLDTLNSLDAYLDALNALAQANEKSGENSKAVVESVENLVISASKLVLAPTEAVNIPGNVVSIATGLLSAFEQFRTAKSFKSRVNNAAVIVEGRYDEVTGKKICTEEKREALEILGKQLTASLKLIDDSNKPKEVKALLKESAIKNFDKDAFKHGCGVIDLLKFTMQDLKKINKLVSELIQRNYRSNNMTTVVLYNRIDVNNSRIQNELSLILEHKNLVAQIKDFEFQYFVKKKEEEKARRKNENVENIVIEKEKLRKEIVRRIKKDKETIDGVFMLDGQVKEALALEINNCDDGKSNVRCAGMMKFIELLSADPDNETNLDLLYNTLPLSNFYTGNSYIESVLDRRKAALFLENRSYLDEKERIKPDYTKTNSELTEMIKKQTQLDGALNSSISALDTWRTTHANLRVTVNTKKTLSVASLVARVKEIWSNFESTAE
jgi:hypothetical protein